jgi:hypothetical protein
VRLVEIVTVLVTILETVKKCARCNACNPILHNEAAKDGAPGHFASREMNFVDAGSVVDAAVIVRAPVHVLGRCF